MGKERRNSIESHTSFPKLLYAVSYQEFSFLLMVPGSSCTFPGANFQAFPCTHMPWDDNMRPWRRHRRDEEPHPSQGRLWSNCLLSSDGLGSSQNWLVRNITSVSLYLILLSCVVSLTVWGEKDRSRHLGGSTDTDKDTDTPLSSPQGWLVATL